LGAEKILKQLKEGVDKKRVGLKSNSKDIARPHYKILNSDGLEIGEVTRFFSFNF
jgi:hypothetical protein